MSDEIKKFKGRLGRAKAATGAASGKRVLKKLFRQAARASRPGGTKAPPVPQARGRGGGKTQPLAAQRVIVRARYVRLKPGQALAQVKRHLGYVERDGAGVNGAPGKAFSSLGHLEETQLTDFAQRAADCPHQFRLIVSPENGSDMDLERATHALVARMENDLGTKLDFVAVVHHDTDNPHVHLLINGKDERGGDLVISRDYMSHGVRERAQEVATDQLGYRIPGKEFDGQIERLGYTSLDRSLERLAIDGPFRLASSSNPFRQAQLGRLDKLRSLGLAEELEPGTWELSKDLKSTLQGISDAARVRDRIQSHLDSPSQQIVVLDPKNDFGPVSGVVVKAGLADDLGDARYVAVQLDDGRLGYATLGARDAHVQVGDRVDISRTKHQATGTADRNLVAFRNEGGEYDPEKHFRSIREDASLPGGATREEFIESHLTRAQALASRGFVSETEAGAFVVPDDLAAKLKAAADAQRGPKEFLQVKVRESRQIIALSQSGSGWIDDHLELHGDRLPGAQSFHQKRLSLALTVRAAELEREGLIVRDGGRLRFVAGARNQLNQRAMNAIGDRLGKEMRLGYVAMPDQRSFSGVVQSTHRVGNGYAIAVRNAQNNTLTLAQAKGLGPRSLNRQIGLQMQGNALRYSFIKDRTLGLSL